MSNIYDAMVAALREHWDANAAALPRQFELTQEAFKALVDARHAAMSNDGYCPPQGWETIFHGVPVLVVEGGGCNVVDKDGRRTSLGISSLFCARDGLLDRRVSTRTTEL